MRKKKEKWPKISVVMTTFNGGMGVKKALESLKRQVYPKNKIEIVIVDNGSNDKSVLISKLYTNKVYVKRKTDGYENRFLAMRMSKGEYIYMILEQDMEFKSRYFLQRMVKPMLFDKSIVASFTREYPKKSQPWVTRFISYDPIQRDPLFEFLSPSIESTIVERRRGYELCNYVTGKIPPTTHMLFRTKNLKQTDVWNQKKDFDHDTILAVVAAGYNNFAYVPGAGIFHHHAKDLTQLVKKRIRNLNNHYFPQNSILKYTWLDSNNRLQILGLVGWILYANLIIPALIRGSYRAIKFKDAVLLMEPIVTVVVTDSILFTFLRNATGRQIISKALTSLFK